MDKEKEMKESLFTKVLIGKFSPENGCFVEEGAILTVKPKKTIKLKDHVNHNFIDSLDKKTKSRYGWVKMTAPFTLENFLTKYGVNPNDSEEIHHVSVMLTSISKLSEDTPVAATYSERGVESKRMEFTVHRVFFRH